MATKRLEHIQSSRWAIRLSLSVVVMALARDLAFAGELKPYRPLQQQIIPEAIVRPTPVPQISDEYYVRFREQLVQSHPDNAQRRALMEKFQARHDAAAAANRPAEAYHYYRLKKIVEGLPQ